MQKRCPACGSANHPNAQYCGVCAFAFNQPPMQGAPGYGNPQPPTQNMPGYGNPYGQPFGQPYQQYPAAYVTPEDRQMSMVMWIGSMFFPILAPLLFVLICANRPLIHRNSLHALGFQIWFLIASLVLIPISFITCGLGFLLYIPLVIIHILFPILGACAAMRGEVYEPPCSGNMTKRWFRI